MLDAVIWSVSWYVALWPALAVLALTCLGVFLVARAGR